MNIYSEGGMTGVSLYMSNASAKRKDYKHFMMDVDMQHYVAILLRLVESFLILKIDLRSM